MPSSTDRHTTARVPKACAPASRCLWGVQCSGMCWAEAAGADCLLWSISYNPSETLNQNQFRVFGGLFHPLIGTASPPSEVCVCPAESPTCPCSTGTRQGSWTRLPPAHQSPRRLGSSWGADRRSITSSSLRHQGRAQGPWGGESKRPPGWPRGRVCPNAPRAPRPTHSRISSMIFCFSSISSRSLDSCF